MALTRANRSFMRANVHTCIHLFVENVRAGLLPFDLDSLQMTQRFSRGTVPQTEIAAFAIRVSKSSGCLAAHRIADNEAKTMPLDASRRGAIDSHAALSLLEYSNDTRLAAEFKPQNRL